MTCVSCGKPLRVLNGVCSSCGHTADPIDFKTQLDAWAKAVGSLNEDPEPESPNEDPPELIEPEPEAVVEPPEPEPEAVVEPPELDPVKPTPAKRPAKKSAKAKD